MSVLLVFQIIIGISLVTAVLLQSSKGGLGTALGGGGAYHTKRGLEKGLFYLTISLAVIFTCLSIIILALK